jgi:2'-5' RNA ligase
MSLLRAFIAVEIPPEIQQAIAEKTASLQKSAGRSVRWVTRRNLHLTLKFLGEIPLSNVDLINRALMAEAGQHSPFKIEIGNLGAFPNVKRPRVIWIGLEAPPDLKTLQHGVESALERLGYAAEAKPFSPHLTIGRIRDQVSPDELQSLRAALASIQIGKLGTAQVESVHLYQSDLQPGGSIYTRLFSAPLKNNHYTR